MFKDRINWTEGRVRWGLVPLCLFLLWLFLTFLFILIYDTSFSVLSYNHDKQSVESLSNKKILARDKIIGEFKAKDDNLGIVSLRFQVGLKIPYNQEDVYVFRIREKGQNDWYYANTYRSGMMYDVPFFPFGFPLIKDSKDKTYTFEIESLHGNDINGLSIADREPVLATKYQESKNELILNRDKLIAFIGKKFVNSFQVLDVQFASFIYSLPFFFYFLWITLLKNYVTVPIMSAIFYCYGKKDKTRNIIKILNLLRKNIFYRFDLMILAVIAFDIFYVQLMDVLKYIMIVALWIIILRIYKFSSEKSITVSISLLVLCPFLLSFERGRMAEESASWAFVFLSVGIVHMLSGLKEEK